MTLCLHDPTWASSCLLWSSKMAILASNRARCWRNAFSSELCKLTWEMIVITQPIAPGQDNLTVLSPRVAPAKRARCSFSNREFSSLETNGQNNLFCWLLSMVIAWWPDDGIMSKCHGFYNWLVDQKFEWGLFFHWIKNDHLSCSSICSTASCSRVSSLYSWELGCTGIWLKNIAKGTTDPRVEFISQDHSSQLKNLEHITISESRLSINFKISTKHQHLD